MNPQRSSRLLIGDDQAHVLEALEFLLRPEGYSLVSVRAPALVLAALASSEFDGVLIDLNYARDTTSGQEGLDLLIEIRQTKSACSRHCDDRVGLG